MKRKIQWLGSLPPLLRLAAFPSPIVTGVTNNIKVIYVMHLLLNVSDYYRYTRRMETVTAQNNFEQCCSKVTMSVTDYEQIQQPRI